MFKFRSIGHYFFIQYRNKYTLPNVIKRKPIRKKIEHIGNPLITCKRPEFTVHRGDYRNEEAPLGSIELCSDGWHHYKSKNDFFIIHPHMNAEDEIQNRDHEKTFDSFGINKQLQLNLEDRLNCPKTTMIQNQAIPKILHNHHTLIAAETGCGKTLAYLVPILENVLRLKQSAGEQSSNEFNTPKVLIITPSRELANQIGEVCDDVCHNLNIKTRVLIGGHTKSLMKNPPIEDIDVLVASIGALSKLITNNIYRMHEVRHVVLDEADTLLDDGFKGKLQYILKRFPFYKNVQEHDPSEVATQLVLASATMPTNVNESLELIIDPSTIHSAVSPYLHKVMPHITQKFMRMRKSQRQIELLDLVKHELERKRPVIVFSNKNETCDFVSMFLNDYGYESVSLNKSCMEKIRRQQFKKFQSGLVNVLSTTDLASRGLDTTRACHVINFDFPMYISDYIHRCGRIGRFTSAKNCRVTNFITGLNQLDLVRQIEHTVRTKGILPNVDANVHGIITGKMMKELETEEQQLMNYLKFESTKAHK